MRVGLQYIIDEFTRLRFLAAYPEQSTYSSADFLRKLRTWYARRGIQVECVQTDNGSEFTNRFSGSKRDMPTLFERTAAELGIRHKLIRPYTPRHNGKVERSHREDQKRFYSCRSFYSLDDFAKQLAHETTSLALPSRVLCPICLKNLQKPTGMLLCIRILRENAQTQKSGRSLIAPTCCCFGGAPPDARVRSAPRRPCRRGMR